MKKIILDTNFLLIPAQFKVDIFSEIDRIADFRYELLIFDKTIDELKNIIEKQKTRHKEAAKIAVQLIKNKKISIIKTDKKTDVDSLILDFVDKNTNDKNIIVATQDKILKDKLKRKGLKTIILKNKKYLAIL